ncbi:MCE family protein [Nocardioides sp. HDW12B]|uniref:MCE family protein n=1 Tax=Nocardioides sp. HDW12B TaxID=2714939 RepID=UPI001408552E|nr:MCE family protein [Nocardioides sp. HDW12B]QIK66708.1 MCE family protein [Nocardioides sp. HDW12B]
MRGRSDAQVARIGLYAVLVAVLLLAAAMNLQKFPGFRGASFQAEFGDASGLHRGNMVQIAGIDVGRISEVELRGEYVVAHFTLDPGVEFGADSTAAIEVLNLLGEKYIDLTPLGEEKAEPGSTIPLERTDSSYDIVRVFTELSDTTESIDIPQLQDALTSVGDTLNRSSDEATATFEGLSRLSTTIASRDTEIASLLQRANRVSTLLADRKGDVVQLIRKGELILSELRNRREAIHRLLLNTASLSRELGGLVDDNQEQIGPMLADLRTVTQTLVRREKDVQASIHNLGPYVRILSNVIGTGPWFDAYASNLGNLVTGQFTPEVDR